MRPTSRERREARRLRPTRAEPLDGVLVVDKPEGLTSHDVVAAARRALGETRIGHTGTLDPLATGVLPLVCGRATRLARFLTASDKDYEATVRFGIATDSYDVSGEETSRTELEPSREAVVSALESLRGEYMQTPPAYSAKKVAGRRAYDLARRDQAVALEPVPVHVTRAELREFSGKHATIGVTCSAGFYVRSFAHTLGQLVGTGACLEALERRRSGEFTLDEAVPLDHLENSADMLIPMARLLRHWPAVAVTAEGLIRVSHGQMLEPSHVVGSDPGDESYGGQTPVTGRTGVRPQYETTQGWVRVFDAAGALVALATPGEARGFLHPSVVLA
jgi:tRNA pseudouridine55 synthase